MAEITFKVPVVAVTFSEVAVITFFSGQYHF